MHLPPPCVPLRLLRAESKDDDDGMSMLVELSGAAGMGGGEAAAAGGGGGNGGGGNGGAAEEGARIKVTFTVFQVRARGRLPCWPRMLLRRLCTAHAGSGLPAAPVSTPRHYSPLHSQQMFRRLVNSLAPEDRKKIDFNAGLAWQVMGPGGRAAAAAAPCSACLRWPSLLVPRPSCWPSLAPALVPLPCC